MGYSNCMLSVANFNEALRVPQVWLGFELVGTRQSGALLRWPCGLYNRCRAQYTALLGMLLSASRSWAWTTRPPTC